MIVTVPALIAVIDDDESLRAALLGLFRSLGYEARGFGAAEDFLKAGEIPAFSCIISDIQMPGSLDGFALAHWVRRHRPELRILLTSGIVRSAALADDLCEQNNEPILSKPYEHQQLVRKLRKLVGEDDGNG